MKHRLVLVLAVLLFASLVFAVERGESWDRTCNGEVCTLSTYAAPVNMQAANGTYLPFTDVVDFSWSGNLDGGLNLSWPQGWVLLKPFVVYNGNYVSLQQIKTAYPAINFKEFISKNRGGYKWALNFTGIPDSIKNKVNFIGLDLAESSGITWNDVVFDKNNSRLIFFDEVQIGYGDLLESGFTLNFTNKTRLLIGNVSGKNSLWLDPTTTKYDLMTGGAGSSGNWFRDGSTCGGTSNDNALWTNLTSDNWNVGSGLGTDFAVFRVFYSFNTSSIPDEATISSAKITVDRAVLAAGERWVEIHGGGYWGNTLTATAWDVGVNNSEGLVDLSIATAQNVSLNLSFINITGFSQFRFRADVENCSGSSSSFNSFDTSPSSLFVTYSTPLTCGTLSTAGATYELTNNVTSNATCFTISANNVTLDLMGYWINYSNNASSSSYAVSVNSNLQNITIRNGTITPGNQTAASPHGIVFGTTQKNGRVHNITAYMYGLSSPTAIRFSTANMDNCSAYWNTITLNGTGVGIYMAGNTPVTRSYIHDNVINKTGIGSDTLGAITVDSMKEVYNNTIYVGVSTGRGIQIDGSNTEVYLNKVIGYSNIYTHGIVLSGSASANTSVHDNNVTSYYVSAGNYYRIYQTSGGGNNSIYNNTLYAAANHIVVILRSRLPSLTDYYYSNNITTTGSGSGFSLSTNASNTEIYDNNITTNGTSPGIYSPSNYNISIHDNTIRCNTGNAGYGIRLNGIFNSSIYRNNITTTNLNAIGILVDSSVSTNLSIYSNRITTTGGSAHGISTINWAFNNLIYSNNISIYGTGYPIRISNTTGNQVYNNTLRTNNSVGYGLLIDNTAANNSAYSNNITVLGGAYGALVTSAGANNNRLYSNNVFTSGSSGYGIVFNVLASNNSAYSNTVTTMGLNGHGLLASNCSNNSFYNNVVTVNGTTASGIYLLSNTSYHDFYGNKLSSIYAGIFIYGMTANVSHNNTFANNTIVWNNTAGYYDIIFAAGNTTNNVFLNTSYANYSTIYWNAYANASFQWYARANVTDSSGNPISGASVNITNSTSATPMVQTTTDANGLTNWFVLTDFTGNKTANTTYNPHNFTGLKTGYLFNSTNATINYAAFPGKTIQLTVQDEVSNTAPNVSLNSPADASWNQSKTVTYAYTPADNSGFANCSLWTNETSWNSKANNASAIVNNSANYITYAAAADGTYLWNVQCFDNGNPPLSAFNTNRTIKIDSTAPATISFVTDTPTANSNLSQNFFDVNATFSEANQDSCSIEINSVNGTRFAPSTSGALKFCQQNQTSLGEGTFSFKVWVNDSAGNWGVSAARTVTLDRSAPSFSSTAANVSSPAAWVAGLAAQLNTTINGTYSQTQTVYLEWSGANASVSSVQGSEWYVEKSGFSATNYTWRFWAQDYAGNWGVSSPLQWFNVSKAAGSTSLGTNLGWTRTYNGADSSTTCSGTPSANFFRNGSSKSSPDAIGAAAAYFYECSFAGNANYTASNSTNTLLISQAPSSLLLVNNLSWSASWNQAQNTSCFLNVSGAASLFRNGTGVSNPDFSDLPAGTYNYSCSAAASENYSAPATVENQFVVSQVAATTQAWLNGVHGNNAVVFGTALNLTATANYGTAVLHLNSSTTANPFSSSLPSRIWNVSALTTGDANHSAAIESFQLNLSQAPSSLNLSNNVSWTGISSTAAFNISCAANSSEVSPSLWRNGTAVSNPYVGTLAKGAYNVSCNASASENYSAPITAFQQFTITNTPPSVDAVGISPALPVKTSDLSVNATCSDPDAGNTITAFYSVFVNNTLFGNLSGSAIVSNGTNSLLETISSGNLSKGQGWIVQVICGDGTDNSSASNSSTVVVQNSAPVFGAFSPSQGQSFAYPTGVTLSFPASDADNDSLTYSVYGQKGDLEAVPSSLLQESNASSYDWGALSMGDWWWRVVVSDGSASAQISTKTFRVQGSGGNRVSDGGASPMEVVAVNNVSEVPTIAALPLKTAYVTIPFESRLSEVNSFVGETTRWFIGDAIASCKEPRGLECEDAKTWPISNAGLALVLSLVLGLACIKFSQEKEWLKYFAGAFFFVALVSALFLLQSIKIEVPQYRMDALSGVFNWFSGMLK